MKSTIRALALVWSLLGLASLGSVASAEPVFPTAPPVATGVEDTSAGEAIYKSHCSMCHDTGAGHAPSKDSLKQISPEAVLRALSIGGAMAGPGSALSDDEKHAVARYVTGKAFGAAPVTMSKAAFCSTKDTFDPLVGPRWDNWGGGDANTRFAPAAVAGMTAADVPKLKLKWAFAFPDALISNTHPIVAGGRLFVASWNRTVYSLDAESGCIRWAFKTTGFVRSAPLLARASATAPWRIYFGDWDGKVYAIDAVTGEQVWTAMSDDAAAFPKISGSLKVYDGRLFVPVTSNEEVMGGDYPCCKVPGRFVAFDAATGKKLWSTPTIFEPARKRSVTKLGVGRWGPSGAGTWSSPTIDAKLGAIYLTTGDNHSHPTTATSDAFIALDMKTGKVLWHRQFTRGDAYNGGPVGCASIDKRTCPTPHGDDYDFGASTALVTLPGGKRLLISGQKSGLVHAVDPDRKGAVVWQTRVASGGSYGGVEFGVAVDDKAVYAPISDIDTRPQKEGEVIRGLLIGDRTKGGGLAALDLRTGKRIWVAPPPPLCAADRPLCLRAQTSAPTVIPGVVFDGALDGHIRAYSTKTGKVVWDYDTIRTYDTVNGPKGQGGAVGGSGAVVAGGVLYTSSGDGLTSQPGNVLLAFSAR